MSLGVGIIGCGNISDIYLRNATLFRDIAVVACADLDPAAAQRQGETYGLPALTPAELLGREDVAIVLNLTIPEAHAEVSMRALEAGKHVYSEKPLATTLADGARLMEAARSRNLRIGAAPDTVLGAGYQTARAMIDEGRIGRPLTGLAAFMGHGMEHWHPNPAFFFRKGAGPVFDMGPYYLSALVQLLGPVAHVQALAQMGFAERRITTPGSKHLGETIRVETPTSVQGLLEFVGGAQVTFLTSWDVWRHGVEPLELHGEAASLRLPDPNFFGGTIRIAEGREDWRDISVDEACFGRINDPRDKPTWANYRGLGLADMARAILDGRPHRASGDVALHVLAVMEGLLAAAEQGRRLEITSACDRPAPLGEAEAMDLRRAASPA